ncbi:unnamed protein product [Trichogramma brassicae]|uniref:C2H2-type domain-containing protein n=1 Tax=Trichogramma brassicae TaxID=86971 RepID=A0A6H5HZL0_9HYME|nr:unnamed protein product [Trichogramma brassicae]
MIHNALRGGNLSDRKISAEIVVWHFSISRPPENKFQPQARASDNGLLFSVPSFRARLLSSKIGLDSSDSKFDDETKRFGRRCAKRFGNKQSLLLHIKTVHDQCEKKLGQKHQLLTHQRTVREGRKDYECDKCVKKFGHKAHLLVHQRTVHEGHKDYTCDNCEKKFGHKSHLLRHQKTVHEGRKDYAFKVIKDYSCGNCGKKFDYKNLLLLHIKIVHDGRKDYACEKCEKKFGRNLDLIRHQTNITRRSARLRVQQVLNTPLPPVYTETLVNFHLGNFHPGVSGARSTRYATVHVRRAKHAAVHNGAVPCPARESSKATRRERENSLFCSETTVPSEVVHTESNPVAAADLATAAQRNDRASIVY